MSSGRSTTSTTEIKGLFDAYFGKSYSKKSLLWKHGGHPILPSSPEGYHEQCKYLDICQSIWHRHTNLLTTATGRQIVDVVISFVPELRTLAMQGLCLSSCITEESEEDCSRQLGEMQQMLFQRVEHEKEKLSLSLLSNEHACPSSVFASCCDMSPEILSHESAFISYLEAVPELEKAVHVIWNCGLPSPRCVAVDAIVELDLVSALKSSVSG